MIFTNWIKHKLRLDAPLWACLLIGVVVSLLLPSSISALASVFLFLVYFVARYVWRRGLRKRDQVDANSSGSLTLAFISLYVVIWVYDWVVPDSPRLVSYETAEVGVFDRRNTFDKVNTLPVIRETKNDSLGGSLSKAASVYVFDSMFACTFISGGDDADRCEESLESRGDSRRVELDLDETTIELFVSNKQAKDCIDTACNVSLIQTTQEAIDQFSDRVTDDTVKALPLAEATLLETWENVVVPVRVFNEVSNGWRHVELTDKSGRKEVWKGKH